MKIDNIQNYKFLFAGGGTGGHVLPAISIADEIKNMLPNSEINFVGTKNKIESKMVPNYGYRFYTIWISGFQRKFNISNLMFPVKLIVSIFQSFLLLKNLKPNVVIGTGGYVCGPIIFVSNLIGIPTVLHESNSFPGITTRILGKFSNLLLLGFENTKKYFTQNLNLEVVGIPTREVGTISKITASKFFNLDEKKKTILVFGGSLGAKSINSVIEKNIIKIEKLGFQLIWQTGNEEFNNLQTNKIRIYPFIDNMNMAYSVADLVVCRAGAMSVAEVIAANKKVIFVPYPFATDNHQFVNATEGLKKISGTIIVDKDLNEKLVDEIKKLSNLKTKKTISIKKNSVNKVIAQKIIKFAK